MRCKNFGDDGTASWIGHGWCLTGGNDRDACERSNGPASQAAKREAGCVGKGKIRVERIGINDRNRRSTNFCRAPES